MAYSLVLKDVGVVTQTLYLVATAMRLAVCAIGRVNLDATARVFGTDWRTEPAVGEVVIGRAPQPDPSRPGEWLPANDPWWADRARDLLRGEASPPS
jgi:Nitroreductase family